MSASFVFHIEVAMEAAINTRVSIRALTAPFYRRILEQPEHSSLYCLIVYLDSQKGLYIFFIYLSFLADVQNISESKYTQKMN